MNGSGARVVRDDEAAGSNPVFPTIKKVAEQQSSTTFFVDITGFYQKRWCYYHSYVTTLLMQCFSTFITNFYFA